MLPVGYSSRIILACKIALGVAVIAAASLTALSLSSVRTAITLATTHQPEHFTELYFNDSRNLPRQVTARKTATLSYHVTNHEARPIAYDVQVTLLENGVPLPIETDHFGLIEGQGYDGTIHFTAAHPGSQLRLIVTLPAQNETIYFRSRS